MIRRRSPDSATQRAGLGALGLAALAVAWELAGRAELLGPSWPPLSSILATLADPTRARLFRRAVAATLAEVRPRRGQPVSSWKRKQSIVWSLTMPTACMNA